MPTAPTESQFFLSTCSSKGLNPVARLGQGPLPAGPSCLPIFETRSLRLALNSLRSQCQWPWTLSHLASASQRPEITLGEPPHWAWVPLTWNPERMAEVNSQEKKIAVLWHQRYIQPPFKIPHYLSELWNTELKSREWKFHKPTQNEKLGRPVTLGKLLLLNLLSNVQRDACNCCLRFTLNLL